jgi:hypothetical protein
MVGACVRAFRAALLPAALFTAALTAGCVLMAFVDSARASAATFAPLSTFGTGGSGEGQIDQLSGVAVDAAGHVSPAGQEPQLIGKRAQRNALESFEGNDCRVVVAAA